MIYEKETLNRITGITVADDGDKEKENFKFWCMDHCPNADVSIESVRNGGVIIDNRETLEDGINILWEMYCGE